MTTSYKGRRDKGIRGEREVRAILEEAGYDVRGLEGLGDHLALKQRTPKVLPETLVLHVEVKRQETLRPDVWARQAAAEAPNGATPVVAYRRSKEPWRVTLSLEDFLGLIS
jgi:Holliday junction resolvase